MIQINLLAKTKNKNSLKKLVYFFENSMNNNFNFINFYFPKKKKKKVITLLKSPHVNKNAQEQFEIKYFYIKIKIFITETTKFLIFLKRIKNLAFADVQIKTKFLNSLKNDTKMFKKKILNSNINFHNFKFVFKNNYFLYKNNQKRTNNLFKFLDITGH